MATLSALFFRKFRRPLNENRDIIRNPFELLERTEDLGGRVHWVLVGLSNFSLLFVSFV